MKTFDCLFCAFMGLILGWATGAMTAIIHQHNLSEQIIILERQQEKLTRDLQAYKKKLSLANKELLMHYIDFEEYYEYK